MSSRAEGRYQSVRPPVFEALAMTAGPVVHPPLTMSMVFEYPVPMMLPKVPGIEVLVFEHHVLAAALSGAASK